MISGAAPARNITVALTSSDTTRLTVPATVILQAGQTTVNFTATLLNDGIIEGGPTPVTVTSEVENWTNGMATTSIIDDNDTMTLSLPTSGWEGQTLAGTVQLGGTPLSPMVVSLTSSNLSELTVPRQRDDPAGANVGRVHGDAGGQRPADRPGKRAGDCRVRRHSQRLPPPS